MYFKPCFHTVILHLVAIHAYVVYELQAKFDIIVWTSFNHGNEEINKRINFGVPFDNASRKCITGFKIDDNTFFVTHSIFFLNIFVYISPLSKNQQKFHIEATIGQLKLFLSFFSILMVWFLPQNIIQTAQYCINTYISNYPQLREASA